MSEKKGIFSRIFGGRRSCSCCNIEINQDTEENCGCSCADGNCNTIEENTPIIEGSMNIKILGSGCKNCITLAENVKLALSQMDLQASMEKVTDISAIAGYGVMSTPALVINEKVVSYGKVLKPDEIIEILKKVRYSTY